MYTLEVAVIAIEILIAITENAIEKENIHKRSLNICWT